MKITRVLLFMSICLSILPIATDDSKFKMTLQVGNPGGVQKIAFSKDGSMFATANLMNKTIKVWNNKAKLLYMIDNSEDLNNCELAFSPDNKYLAFTNYTYVKIYNFSNGSTVTIKTTSDIMYRLFNGAAFSNDGKYIYTGTYVTLTSPFPSEMGISAFDSYLKKLGESDASELKKYYSLDRVSQKYAFNAELADHSNLYGIFVKLKYDISNTQPVFSNCVEQWDINGNYIKRIGEHNNIASKMISKMVMSKDGKKIMTASMDGTIKIWDLNSGTATVIQGSNEVISNAKFSSDGKFIGWTTYSGVKVCNMSGVYLININRSMTGASDIDIDKKIIAEYGFDSDKNKNPIPMIRIRNLNDEVIKDIKGILSTGYSIQLNPSGTSVVSGTLDGFVNIVNISNDYTVSLINDKSEWLCFTPDGYWDSSKNGGKLVAMIHDLEAFSVDQFAIKYNRPDIIMKRLGTENDDVINYYYYQYQKRLRKMNFKEEDLSGELHIPEAVIANSAVSGKFMNLDINLTDSSYNLKSYNIYVNDVPIFGTYGKQIDGKSVSVKENIELSTGDNKIEISCLNEKGAESYRAMISAEYGTKTGGDLYYIGFGVSKYLNSDLNLEYADKDAKDLENTFKRMKGHYNGIHTATFTNEDVTVANIRKAKELLRNAKVDDTFVLFIAGHGVHDRDKESTYYFLTYDTDINNLSKNCADFDMIEDILQGIAPRNKLFLMDTCESGETDDDMKIVNDTMSGSRGLHSRSIRRGTNTSNAVSKIVMNNIFIDTDRYINNNLVRRSGSIVFSACKGGEYSYESDDIKNGYFTHEIMNALKDDNGGTETSVSVDDLRNMVSQSVSRKTSGLQNPTVDRDNIFIKFSFPVIK
jgi:WD40 repeat protein